MAKNVEESRKESEELRRLRPNTTVFDVEESVVECVRAACTAWYYELNGASNHSKEDYLEMAVRAAVRSHTVPISIEETLSASAKERQ